MTQLRCDPHSIRNYFDTLGDGIGHRGSSFSDIDAISHDAFTHRFLVQEFKRPGEMCSAGQKRLLEDLALEPRFTVWYLMPLNERNTTDGDIVWADMLHPETLDIITPDEYRHRLTAWWENRYDCGRFAEIAAEKRLRRDARKVAAVALLGETR